MLAKEKEYKMVNNKWTPKNKTYGVIKGTNYYGVKLVGKDSPREDGKSAFFIMQKTDAFGNGKKLHDQPLTHYPAYMQFKAIVENNPKALENVKFNLNSNGSIPTALVSLLGTDKVAKEIEGVPTLSQCKQEMQSWSS